MSSFVWIIEHLIIINVQTLIVNPIFLNGDQKISPQEDSWEGKCPICKYSTGNYGKTYSVIVTMYLEKIWWLSCDANLYMVYIPGSHVH